MENPEAIFDALSIRSMKERYYGTIDTKKDVQPPSLPTIDMEFLANQEALENFVQDFTIDDSISDCFADSDLEMSIAIGADCRPSNKDLFQVEQLQEPSASGQFAYVTCKTNKTPFQSYTRSLQHTEEKTLPSSDAQCSASVEKSQTKAKRVDEHSIRINHAHCSSSDQSNSTRLLDGVRKSEHAQANSKTVGSRDRSESLTVSRNNDTSLELKSSSKADVYGKNPEKQKNGDHFKLRRFGLGRIIGNAIGKDKRHLEHEKKSIDKVKNKEQTCSQSRNPGRIIRPNKGGILTSTQQRDNCKSDAIENREGDNTITSITSTKCGAIHADNMCVDQDKSVFSAHLNGGEESSLSPSFRRNYRELEQVRVTDSRRSLQPLQEEAEVEVCFKYENEKNNTEKNKARPLDAVSGKKNHHNTRNSMSREAPPKTGSFTNFLPSATFADDERDTSDMPWYENEAVNDVSQRTRQQPVGTAGYSFAPLCDVIDNSAELGLSRDLEQPRRGSCLAEGQGVLEEDTDIPSARPLSNKHSISKESGVSFRIGRSYLGSKKDSAQANRERIGFGPRSEDKECQTIPPETRSCSTTAPHTNKETLGDRLGHANGDGVQPQGSDQGGTEAGSVFEQLSLQLVCEGLLRRCCMLEGKIQRLSDLMVEPCDSLKRTTEQMLGMVSPNDTMAWPFVETKSKISRAAEDIAWATTTLRNVASGLENGQEDREKENSFYGEIVGSLVRTVKDMLENGQELKDIHFKLCPLLISHIRAAGQTLSRDNGGTCGDSDKDGSRSNCGAALSLACEIYNKLPKSRVKYDVSKNTNQETSVVNSSSLKEHLKTDGCSILSPEDQYPHSIQGHANQSQDCGHVITSEDKNFKEHTLQGERHTHGAVAHALRLSLSSETKDPAVTAGSPISSTPATMVNGETLQRQGQRAPALGTAVATAAVSPSTTDNVTLLDDVSSFSATIVSKNSSSSTTGTDTYTTIASSSSNTSNTNTIRTNNSRSKFSKGFRGGKRKRRRSHSLSRFQLATGSSDILNDSSSGGEDNDTLASRSESQSECRSTRSRHNRRSSSGVRLRKNHIPFERNYSDDDSKHGKRDLYPRSSSLGRRQDKRPVVTYAQVRNINASVKRGENADQLHFPHSITQRGKKCGARENSRCAKHGCDIDDVEKGDEDVDKCRPVRVNVPHDDLSDEALRVQRLRRHLQSVQKLRQRNHDVIETVITGTGERLAPRPLAYDQSRDQTQHVNIGEAYPFRSSENQEHSPGDRARLSPSSPSSKPRIVDSAAGNGQSSSSKSKRAFASFLFNHEQMETAEKKVRELTESEFEETFERRNDATVRRRREMDSGIPWEQLQFSGQESDGTLTDWTDREL